MATTNASSTDQAYLQIFALQAPAYGFYIIIGLTAIINNILIIATIGKSPALHNKSMCLLARLAVAELILSASLMLLGIKRLLYYAFGRLENVSHLSCVLQMLPLSGPQHIAADLTLALSIDRFLALKFPIFHRAMKTKKYIILVNFVAWLDGLIVGLVPLDQVKWGETVPFCTAALAYSPTLIIVHSNWTNGKVILTVAVYSVTAVFLLKRLRALRNLPMARRREERGKLELSAFRTIVLIATMFALCNFLLFFGASIFSALSKDAATKYLAMLAALLIVNSASHLFIYLSLSKVFRSAFQITICAKNSAAGDPCASSTSNRVQSRKW